MTSLSLALTAVAVVGATMLAELWRSTSNERWLRSQGAVAVPDEVFGTMRWGYPATFVAMAIEGAWFGPTPGTFSLLGAVLFVAAKLLKYWAIASLGRRWSYGVYVLPGRPLVASGPYAWMRHPNYVAVIGELVAMALLVGARVTGPLALLFFASLLRRRIVAEERALTQASS